ncbi:glycosyl hydrolase family 8 [Maledivibacter halophilus]|uniref:Endoglucanase Y n=1 Tax=Maledivibacter halophilus TaxID=36842 RepID=A0A1T5MD86_9FIRM|nr:glycosyl hydrolase family 8 [Maledivibacter halophilus]SKC86207.1 Endoglucanase Y [Maledivibacter halophilus]
MIKFRKKIIIVFSLILLSLLLIYLTPIDFKKLFLSNITREKNIIYDELTIPKPEKEALKFLAKKMSGPDFSIYTNYINKESDNSIIATGKDVLSESQGLFLLYLLNRNKKEAFDTCFNWTLDNLYLDNGLFSWIKRKDEKKEKINALIDDLRIIRTAILASEKWNEDSYLKYIKNTSKSLLLNNTKDFTPIDFYDLNTGSKSDYITISYLDLYTMKKLISVDSEWKEIYSSSYNILKGGKIKNTGLYKYQYNLNDKEYTLGDNINLIQSVYAMIHLAEVGHYDKDGMNWLWEAYTKNGKLYAHYCYESFKPVSKIESTALYSLAARLFYLAGENQKAKTLLEESEKFQIINQASKGFGSFGSENNLQIYSFDNLQYILSSSMIYK